MYEPLTPPDPVTYTASETISLELATGIKVNIHLNIEYFDDLGTLYPQLVLILAADINGMIKMDSNDILHLFREEVIREAFHEQTIYSSECTFSIE